MSAETSIRTGNRHWLTAAAVLTTLLLGGCGGGSAAVNSGSNTVATIPVANAEAQKVLDHVKDAKVDPPDANPDHLASASTGDPYDVLGGYVENVLNNVDTMWAGLYQQSNLKEGGIGLALASPGAESGTPTKCKDATGQLIQASSTYDTVFYCGIDSQDDGPGLLTSGFLWLPSDTIIKVLYHNNILKGDKSAKADADFKTAMILVDEYSRDGIAELATQTSAQPASGKYGELTADCFAGVWLAHNYASVSEQQFQSAVDALNMLGDFKILPADQHAGADERLAALKTGYAAAAPAECVQQYWQSA